jgi:hypothetical protein
MKLESQHLVKKSQKDQIDTISGREPDSSQKMHQVHTANA